MGQYPHIATVSEMDGWHALTQTSRVLGERFGVTMLEGMYIPDGVRTIMLHAWDDGYRELIHDAREHGVRPIVVYHSPIAQSELDDEGDALRAFLALRPREQACCHAMMAQVLGVPWFPVPIDQDEFSPRSPRPIGETLRVGIWNAKPRRKNLWTQLVACRELVRISGHAVDVHYTGPDDDLARELAGEATIVPVPKRPREAYLDEISAMDVNLQCTHAESTNYCAIESTLLGVPCLTGPQTPAGQYGMQDHLSVSDVTNPTEIAEVAWHAIRSNRQEWFRSRMISEMQAYLDYRDAVLVQLLDAIGG